jgi:HEXXH motif-containing protein
MTPTIAFEDLTLPREGSRTAHRVFSAALRRSMAELRHELRAVSVGRSAPGWATALRDDVERLAISEPGLLATVARDVHVSVWLRCLRGPTVDPMRGARGLALSLSLALAHADALSQPTRVRSPGWTAASLFARQHVPASEAEVEVAPDGSVSVDGASLDVPPAIFSIDGSQVLLATADGNPLWSREEHPDKSGNAVDLGGHPASEWTEMLARALTLIGEFEPDLRREIELGLQLFVPVGFDANQHVSATFAEALGQAYLSLHPSPLTMAEAIIHEFSHNKIGAAIELGPLLENPWDEHPSPVRPDDRPLHGVLLAAHAFVPVARFCQRIRDAKHPLANAATEHLQRYMPMNHEAISTLQTHGRWTQAGRPVVAELAAWADRHPMP